ncbi:MAG TPA: aminotransferase class I/II-fold pyridoxal phosphate-dependent enzyme [Opitutaceae bacterium]|nr:aminotransferase class I/II-fold pyridoxal phosphate-dependent enzyme [Opitutaceae bacterium]
MLNTNLDRREWLKTAGTAIAGLAFVSQAPRLRAQHEADKSAARSEPVRISFNENPFGPSPAVTAAILQTTDSCCRYPVAEVEKLVKQIAEKEGVPKEYIVLGVGSGEILDMTGIHCGLNKGEIIAAEPGYLQIIETAERFGGKGVWVPLDKDLKHDLNALAAKVNERTSLVYICNPNNPTGTIVNPNDLREFIKTVSPKAPVFVDEAYLDCSDNYAANTMVDMVRKGFNVVVTRTFSKIHGMAGLRIGYGIMQPKFAKKVQPFGTGSLNILGVVGASASLEDKPFIEETRLKIKAGRDALIAVVKELGKTYAEPQGNFVFIKTGMDVKEFGEKMKAENILVGRPFPPLTTWARISIGLPEQMAVCHQAMRKVLKPA